MATIKKRRKISDSINKSKAVRAILRNGKTKPKEVSEDLRKKGIVVSPAYVSTIKSSMKRGTRKVPTTASLAKKDDATVAVSHLRAATQYVRRVGGIQNAVTALSVVVDLDTQKT